MEILTERAQVRTVVQRWRRQYPPTSLQSKWQAIGAELETLDVETATAQDVAEQVNPDR